MKNLFLLFFLFLGISVVNAQTWDGSESTNWDTPGNWNTNAPPAPGGNVTIPGNLTNYPVLASNVTINNIDMQAGSSLDFNGFNLTINTVSTGFSYFIGTTLNNSNGATDIVVNITSVNGYTTYVRNAIVNDNITFNLGGTATFAEADISNTGNHFTGNLTISEAGTGTVSLSNGDTSRYDGNVTISRPGAGPTDAFGSGAIIGGNFSFTNNTAGNTSFGSLAKRTTVGGTINIAINDTLPSTFELLRVINSTNGGTINVQKSRGFSVQQDTVLVTALNITGYRGTAFGTLYDNRITGNVVIADDISNGGGYNTYARNNNITGNATFTMNGTNNFLDGDVGASGNHYTGNISVTGAGTGTISLSNGDTSRYDGNLTINRSGAGTTDAFGSGAIIGGNFSFTNNTAGNSSFGSLAKRTTVGGTINISINDTLSSTFELLRVINSANGGTINVQNSRGFSVQQDTILVTALNITGYRGTAFGTLYDNRITGNVVIADDVSGANGYNTYARNNTVTGNASFTMNGTNNFYDGDIGGSGNHYTGNLTITGAGPGSVSLSNGDTSRYDGNLTISRPGAGSTDAFGSGAIIGGNFSFTNNSAGNASFGSLSKRTTIGGIINVLINNTTPSTFEFLQVINSTNGGTINVQNSRGFSIQQDTLLVNGLTVTGYRGTAFGYLLNNSITGNVEIADDVSAGSGYNTYIRNNSVTGNANFTNNGSNILYDGDIGNSGNRYSGSVSYSTTGSAVNVGADTTEIGGNLTINSSANITFTNIKLNGSTSSNIEQLGSQPIVIPQLIIEKTGAAIISLNDPVTVSTKLFFNGGHIVSSPVNYLRFADNANYTGASDASHVNGAVFKAGNDAFIFPVGDGTILKTAAITAPAVVTDVFSAEYLKSNPHLAGYDTSAFGGSILRVSGFEYWNVKRESGASNVTLTLSYTDPGSGDYITVPADSRIARWTGSTWEDLGNSASTGTTAGTVTSGTAVTNFTPGPFTFGSANLQTNPLLDVILYTYYADTDNDTFGDAANSITSPSTTAPVGYVANNTDCDDNDNTVYPGAPELCDGKDNNCNGTIDEGITPPTFYRDLDGDGFGDAANSVQTCTAPAGYVSNNTDCDDNDNTVFPGAPELCDGKDNNCNGTIDEGVGTTFYRDLDNDGFGDAANSQIACSLPVGYVANDDDCDDNDNTVYPGAPELCDGKDNNCNGTIDEGVGTTFYRDLDADGFGDVNNSQVACTAPAGYVANNTDCDDNDNTVYPGAPELCDGKDNDCNGTIDDGAGTTPYYADADGDGFGDPNVSVIGCTIPPGYVSNNTDCDDADNTVYPGAPELCDGKDNNCNGTIDEGVGTTFYRDLDGDGFGDANNSQVACSAPAGYVANNTDCDDNDNTVYPGAPELCDGKDNDCNGTIDDGAGTTPYYADADGDGFGDPNVSIIGCTIPPGYVSNNTDCDDNDNTVYPGAPELCDGKDNNCNGTIDEGVGTTFYIDLDGDGFGDANNSQVACSAPAGYVADNTDCDDTNNTVYPGAPEIIDGLDNNCNGLIDEGGLFTFYLDSDNDGFGDINNSVTAATAPPGYVSNSTDCSDNDNTIYPGAPELCDGKDNDCDGIVDDGAGQTFYIDLDGDGFGDPASTIFACTAPAGYVSNNTDCDDADNTVYPGAPELCDGKDNNCDGVIDGDVSTPVVIGPVNMCPYVGTGEQVVFTINPLPGITGYQWTVPTTVNIVSGQNTNTLTVTILPGFTANAYKQIRVTTTSACGNSPLGIHYLAAQYPSAPGFITGPTEVCSFIGTANEAVYKINKVTAATSYTWSVSAGMTINNHPGGSGVNDTIINVLYGPSFAGGTISVRAVNSCGASINDRRMNISNAVVATPGFIQGPLNACLYMPSAAIPAGSSATYIINKAGNATTYTWAVPAGATITAHPEGTGVNDTVIVVNYSNAFAGGNITVQGNGSCASGNIRSLSIQANLKPGTIGAITSNETQPCPDRQVQYSIPAPTNTNWVQWTVPANAILLVGQGSNTITVSYPSANAGSITATPSNGCGVGKTRTLQVSLTACPSAGFAKGNVAQPSLHHGTLEVQIFPNPTHSEFNINVTSVSKERIQVRIYDVNGKQYLPGNINIHELTNFGNNLKAGVYLVEVTQGSQRKITRVVKF